MSEAFEIARRMATTSPLAVAALHTESDRLAYLDSQNMTAAEVGHTVRTNVADELELEAARLRGQANRHNGAPMGQSSRGGPAAPVIADFRALDVFALLTDGDGSGTTTEEQALFTRFANARGFRGGHYSHNGDDSDYGTCEVTGAYGRRIGFAYVTQPEPVRYRLARVPLNGGGYDRIGTYWGLGAPLYAFEATEGEHSGHVRARSRELAKAKVRELAPAATFYA